MRPLLRLVLAVFMLLALGGIAALSLHGPAQLWWMGLGAGAWVVFLWWRSRRRL